MSTRVFFAVAALCAGFAFAGASSAQSSTSPSRAEVKAETHALEKAGKLVPAGEGSPSPAPLPLSHKTRADRKAETLQARKADELHRTGLEPEYKEARALAKQPSTTTRAQRKASTTAAARAHELTPAGEGVDAPKR
jgi:hypothetical protein